MKSTHFQLKGRVTTYRSHHTANIQFSRKFIYRILHNSKIHTSMVTGGVLELETSLTWLTVTSLLVDGAEAMLVTTAPSFSLDTTSTA